MGAPTTNSNSQFSLAGRAIKSDCLPLTMGHRRIKRARKDRVDLLGYRENKYSQFGEDGIIQEICYRQGIKVGWFVEFGAWDGKHLSNTYNLLANKVGKGFLSSAIQRNTKRCFGPRRRILKSSIRFVQRLALRGSQDLTVCWRELPSRKTSNCFQ